MAEVAFVIPVYNGAKFLPDLIESLLAQDADLEIVAVDDGSTDGSSEVLAAYNRVKLIRQSNAGVSAARNAGASHTSSPFLTFIDQDDWLEPTYAAHMTAALRTSPDAAAVYCEAIIHEDTGEVFAISEGDHSSEFFEALLNNVCPMSTGAVMMRREPFFQVGGFDPTLNNVGEDLDLWFKLARTSRWAYVPLHLFHWRGHELNRSTQFVAMYAGVKRLLRRYASGASYRRALSKKQQRCVQDIRRALRRKWSARCLRVKDVAAVLGQVARHPELVPQLVRPPIFRRGR